MRSKKLTTAVAAAVASLALMPAAALAIGAHPGLKGPKHVPLGGACRVRLAVNQHVATVGDSVLLTGALICGPATPVGGQTVTVYEQIAGVPGSFKVIGTTTTAAPTTTTPGGGFTFTPPPLTSNSAFYVSALTVHSATRPVKVAPQVSVTPPAPEGTALLTGIAHRVLFSGSVSPNDANAEVVLQRESGSISEEWGPIQEHIFVSPAGTFSFYHRFALVGDANVRVIVRPHGKFGARGISDVMSYVITQTQNPNLTLEPKPDPIGFGSPLVIKGVTKASSGAKVVLTGRTFGGATSTVGETTAGAGGAWEITIPSAVQNTHYKATSGAFHSADVYEGVKWVITTNPIPASVSSGTPVTFSGTAAPVARTNHVVYLERRNLTGSSWHVVDLALTGPGGTFSIPWYVIGSGKQEYRFKIPGDPINEGVASAPQTIEVTPAPPATPQPVIQPTLPH